MIDIRTLDSLDADALRRIISGYTSHEKYRVLKSETDVHTSITLELVTLPAPYVKVYDHLDDDTLAQYAAVVGKGWSLGAFEGETLVGVLLAEVHAWNQTLWVWEFHVSESQRGRGIGQQLMDRLAARGRAQGLRAMVCETQSTNVPAIRFYRKAGFTLQGVDISYYSNQDYPDGEMAIFMKKHLLT
ncbi:MAG: GNAT family N-acetyltransferase [Anaerolineae bacterium]